MRFRVIRPHPSRHGNHPIVEIRRGFGQERQMPRSLSGLPPSEADGRRAALFSSLDADEIDSGYMQIHPRLDTGLPSKPMAVNERWTEWPAMPELFPVSFSGIKTARDGFLTDIDLDRLKTRIADYFDPTLSHEEIARRHPGAIQPAPRFTPHSVRDTLLARGGPKEDGFIRYAYRPFDDRWLYWEGDTKLLNEKRADYRPHIFAGNLWLSSSHRIRKGESDHRPLSPATSRRIT